ncbi:hypothetical protein ACNHUS_17745 [Actinomycetes bacterium M1A6_2h]
MSFTPQPIPTPMAPLRAAVRYGAIALAVLAVASAVIAYLALGLPGLWGALIGAGLGGAFILLTSVTVLFSARLSPTSLGAVLLGGWIAKMLVAVVVLGILNGMTFYHRSTLGIVVLAALVIVLGAETYGVVRSRTPYVDSTGDSDGK